MAKAFLILGRELACWDGGCGIINAVVKVIKSMVGK